MKKILVFGSNRQGRHGKGTALFARKKCGAIYGQAEGLQGRSYAIITKELRKHKKPVTLKEIERGVQKFLGFAFKKRKKYEFWVTPIGCGLAGFTPEQIAPMFAEVPDNVLLPEEFINVLKPQKQAAKSLKEMASKAGKSTPTKREKIEPPKPLARLGRKFGPMMLTAILQSLQHTRGAWFTARSDKTVRRAREAYHDLVQGDGKQLVEYLVEQLEKKL